MLDAGPVWGSLVGDTSSCLISGIAPRSVVELAATAAATAPYFRNSLRETFFSGDRKSTRLNSSHVRISYAVFCLKKKKHKPASSLCDARALMYDCNTQR